MGVTNHRAPVNANRIDNLKNNERRLAAIDAGKNKMSKLNFDLRKLNRLTNGGRLKMETLIKSIEDEIGGDLVVGDRFVTEQMQTDFDQTDAFLAGYNVATTFARENANQPDVFHMPNKYAQLLQNAITKTVEETYISNTTIKIEADGNMHKVTIAPTSITFLMDVFKNYGVLIAEEKQ